MTAPPEFTPHTVSPLPSDGRCAMAPVLGQCSYAIFSRRRESERLTALDVGRCTAGPCTTVRTWLVIARWHLRREWLARLVEMSQ